MGIDWMNFMVKAIGQGCLVEKRDFQSFRWVDLCRFTLSCLIMMSHDVMVWRHLWCHLTSLSKKPDKEVTTREGKIVLGKLYWNCYSCFSILKWPKPPPPILKDLVWKKKHCEIVAWSLSNMWIKSDLFLRINMEWQLDFLPCLSEPGQSLAILEFLRNLPVFHPEIQQIYHFK